MTVVRLSFHHTRHKFHHGVAGNVVLINAERNARQHLGFHLRKVDIKAVVNGKHERKTYNADCAGKRREQRAAFFGNEVFQTQSKRHACAHGRGFERLISLLFLFGKAVESQLVENGIGFLSDVSHCHFALVVRCFFLFVGFAVVLHGLSVYVVVLRL